MTNIFSSLIRLHMAALSASLQPTRDLEKYSEINSTFIHEKTPKPEPWTLSPNKNILSRLSTNTSKATFMCESAEKCSINTSKALSHIFQSSPCKQSCIGREDSTRRSFWSIRFNETGRRRIFVENICFFIKLLVKPPSLPLLNWIGGNSQWYRTLRRRELMKFLKWNHFAIGFRHFARWKAFANKFSIRFYGIEGKASCL